MHLSYTPTVLACLPYSFVHTLTSRTGPAVRLSSSAFLGASACLALLLPSTPPTPSPLTLSVFPLTFIRRSLSFGLVCLSAFQSVGSLLCFRMHVYLFVYFFPLEFFLSGIALVFSPFSLLLVFPLLLLSMNMLSVRWWKST